MTGKRASFGITALVAAGMSVGAIPAHAGQTGGSGSPGFLSIWGNAPAKKAAPKPQSRAGYWEYGSWKVSVERKDSYEDGVYYNCQAWTGGDGEPYARVGISSQDVGPPHAYPGVTIEEYAPRGYQTYMQSQQRMYLWFDDEDTYDGVVEAYYDNDGLPNAIVSIYYPYSLPVLLAMRRNNQMDVVVEGRVFHSFFLNGFTASYLKMMEGCGFSGVGVVN